MKNGSQTKNLAFHATVSGCVDGRTTRARNVAKIDEATDKLAARLGIIKEGEECMYDMIRIPGPSPLLADDPMSLVRNDMEGDSFVEWVFKLVDAHKGELHILAGHRGGCAMEDGCDRDELVSYEHLYSACASLQKFLTRAFEEEVIPCHVTVAAQMWHIQGMCISHVEAFTMNDLAIELERLRGDCRVMKRPLTSQVSA